MGVDDSELTILLFYVGKEVRTSCTKGMRAQKNIRRPLHITLSPALTQNSSPVRTTPIYSTHATVCLYARHPSSSCVHGAVHSSNCLPQFTCKFLLTSISSYHPSVPAVHVTIARHGMHLCESHACTPAISRVNAINTKFQTRPALVLFSLSLSGAKH